MDINDIQICKRFLAGCAVQALIDELRLTPKPGLVDLNDTGVHDDLNVSIMMRSAESLRETFEKMAVVSFNEEPSQTLREEIAYIGRQGEQEMFQATGGTNSHKGAIWSLGLLVSSASIYRGHVEASQLLETAGRIARFEDRYVPQEVTNGSVVKRKYKVNGAREEAELAFPHIKHFSLPTLLSGRARGINEEDARLNALISLIANLDDTCILHRGGKEALIDAQRLANLILASGGVSTSEGFQTLSNLNSSMHTHNASPGGCADLLAATLFVDRISTYSDQVMNKKLDMAII
ncbi:triphosphoribosyl-dephospho-CoA synthase [Alkalihalophilus lindianensis]|uniref:triphosphoribosyl-dephospho-CoA synthase n=2 Tax=Bacillaceae TaxID=186817 RepID=A0ABU3XDK5_9BACI|nr:triphosphoribosyl-dephospho-CoA synthase [Alkalihalophilus lindianensis]MDV2685962.1 triphosphoribosyl-dephospho-CoA synthase [Alkalihalophilus lindianensis]